MRWFAIGAIVLVLVASGPVAAKRHVPHPTPTPTQTINGTSVLFGLDHPARETDAAIAAGLNTIRIVNFLDEGPTGAPFDSGRWARVDSLIAAAQVRGLRVILDLSTYRNQLRAQGQNPYGEWGPFLAFVGARYRTAPIAYYALAGEPEPREAPLLVAFYSRSTSQLHAAAPGVPVSSGGLLQYGWNSGIDWQAIFRVTDLPAVHVYSQNDEQALPTLASDAAGLGKPLMIEEFGFNQSEGDSQRAADFSRVYGLARTVGARGSAFWNLGPQLGGDTYDVNTATPLTWQVVLTHR
jgi:endo-1,4-beta-mannosidase